MMIYIFVWNNVVTKIITMHYNETTVNEIYPMLSK